MTLAKPIRPEKIKVVHIITLLELGGAQQNTLFTVTHLDREKFEVVLICGPGGVLDEEAGKILNLKIYFLEKMVRSVQPWKDIVCLWQLIQILKKEKPQIVHTHSSKAGILGRLAARWVKVSTIIHTIHGFGFNPYQTIFSRSLFIFLEKWIAKITNVLIAVSENNIQQGLDLGIGIANQYRLIRSGVDIQEIRKRAKNSDPITMKKELGIPQEKKIVLMVAPFKIQKNPTAFVQCAQRVIPLFPEVRFLLVGDGELRKSLELLVEKGSIRITRSQNVTQNLELKSHIQFLGWRRDIPEILSMTDLFVLTSLWEGLPRAAVEALVIGKPVVAFAIDGLKEIIKNGENGFLVPPNSLDELSERIVQILRDENLAKKLSEKCLKTIDDSFDIHQMVGQQEELYLSLIHQRNL